MVKKIIKTDCYVFRNLYLHQTFINYICLINTHILIHLPGRFKSKETDFLGFITKIHNPIFMFFVSKTSQHSCSFRIYFYFSQKLLFFISFDGIKLKIPMSIDGFLVKFHFLTILAIKLYQNSNFAPKNNLFSIFSRK